MHTTTIRTDLPRRAVGMAPILLPLFFTSGACGLIYEIVWSRQLVLIMGTTTFATSTVLVAFMSGLALGAHVAGRVAHRVRRPAAAYGILEVAIGLYALGLPLLQTGATPMYAWLYRFGASNFVLLSAVRFTVSMLLLVLPATLMGATLPLLTQYLARRTASVGRPVALLYGINAFGAVCGAAGAGFVLLPTLGFFTTTCLAAALNVTVGLAAILLLGSDMVPVEETVVRPHGAPQRDGPAAGSRHAPLVLWALALSGFAAMVYQVCWTRVLITQFGAHTYAFTCILCAFILGLALGSTLMARWVERIANPVAAFGLGELGIATGSALVLPLVARMPAAVRWMVLRYQGDFNQLRFVEFGMVILLVLVPTLLMGAIMPLVARVFAGDAAEAGRAIGRAYTANTLGAVAGSFCAGFLMIPTTCLGVQRSILVAVAINGLVGLALVAVAARRRLLRVASWPVAAGAALLAFPTLARPWDASEFVRANFRSDSLGPVRVLYYREGIDATVSVTTDGTARTLRVNSKPDASDSTSDGRTQLLLGHLPALLSENPRTVMVLGLGSGMTSGAVACHPEVERIDTVEISQAVVDAASLFARKNHHILTDPRLNLIRADGRNHLLLTATRYDVIVSEPSNPWLAGVGNLFTVEFFELCRARLAPGGVLAIWLEAYALSPEHFRMVIRSLHQVMPYFTVWELQANDYCLVASGEPLAVAWADWRRRCALPSDRRDLGRVGINGPAALLGCFLADQSSLGDALGEGPVNTDDNARLEFAAPAYLFTPQNTRSGTLEWLVAHGASPFAGLVTGEGAGYRRAVAEVAAIQAGRAQRSRCQVLALHDRWKQATNAAHEAYRLAPTDPASLELIRTLHRALRERIPREADGALRDWVQRAENRFQLLRRRWKHQELPTVIADAVDTPLARGDGRASRR